VLERWRDHEHHAALEKLAAENVVEDEEVAVTVFRNATERLLRQDAERRMGELSQKAAGAELSDTEKAELRGLHTVLRTPLEQADQP
jgi:hypothetical protein